MNPTPSDGKELPFGPGLPPYVIAEAADTHFGDIYRAKEMIVWAADAGVDAIKFQHHYPDEEMLKEVPSSSNMREPLYDFLKQNALSIDDHLELKAECDRVGITYLCTPFSRRAAAEISPLVPFLKVGSGEFTDFYLLEHLLELGKPLLLSTGMSTQKEVVETLKFVEPRSTSQIGLMHCVSGYPPKLEELNLDWLFDLSELSPWGIVGYSSHSPEIYTALAAVAMGASVIEKHVSPPGAPEGPDTDVSLSFVQLSEMVTGIRAISKARGREKKIQETEKEIRVWATRSVVSRVDIKKGETLTPERLCTKRPGTGIPSREIYDLYGSIAKVDIAANTLLKKDMLGTPPNQ